MINWTQLSSMWLGHGDGAAMRRRAVAAITDLLFHGLSVSPAAGFDASLDVAGLMAQPINAFDRAQMSEQKMDQLAGAASRLFNRRGIDGASLDEIAASLGTTKGAVYHYFDDKTDLVVRCYDRAFGLYGRFMTAAHDAGSGFARSMTVMHLNCQAQAGPAPPLMLHPGLFALPEAHRARFVAKARTLLGASRAMVREGIADGSCRHCDAATVAEISAGVFLWLPKWLSDTFAMNASQTADEVCRVLSGGLSIV